MKTLGLAPVFLAAVCTIAGCTPADDQQAEASAASAEAETKVPEPADRKPKLPDDLAGTAWRVAGVDGANYVTFLDPDGRYRDVKDGQPFHGGSWDQRVDGSICFVPDGAETQRRCWTPDGMTDEGDMVVVGGEDGARVELVPADYEPPASEEGS